MTKIHSKIAIIITAAGSSTRIGGNTKKEYLPLHNGTVLSNCANAFFKACSKNYIITDFIITCPTGQTPEARAGQISLCKNALKDFNYADLGDLFRIVPGSTSRQKSVFEGIKAVTNNPDIVVIHDGARPFVTEDVICRSIDAAIKYGASVPGCTPVDTQKELNQEGFIVRHLQRSMLTAVQTPQCFEYERLLTAHKKAVLDKKEYTDDTEIWGVYCGNVKVVEGDPNNIKITFPKDLENLK